MKVPRAQVDQKDLHVFHHPRVVVSALPLCAIKALKRSRVPRKYVLLAVFGEQLCRSIANPILFALSIFLS